MELTVACVPSEHLIGRKILEEIHSVPWERLVLFIKSANSTKRSYFSPATNKKEFFQQLDKSNIEGRRIYEENGKWTRITIGTMKEMETFINAIK